MVYIRRLGLVFLLTLTLAGLWLAIGPGSRVSAIPDLSSGDEYTAKQLESSGGHRLLVSMRRATISGGELSKFSDGRAEVRLATRGATNQDPRYTFRAKAEAGSSSGSSYFFKYGYTTGACSSASTLDRKMYVKKNSSSWSLITEGGTQSLSLTDAATQAGKWLCLEMGWIDLTTPNTAQTPKYVKFKLENEAPNVEFSENADGSISLTANADLKIFKFYYARLSSGTCASLGQSAFNKLESSVSGVIDSATDTNNSLVTEAQITFNSAQAGNSYCFAAQDIHGNFGKSSSAWTIPAPLAITSIDFDRNDNELQAVANRKVGVAWSYVSDNVINNIADYTCDATAFSGKTPVESNVVRLNSDNAGSTNFCFKATRGDETAYRKIRAPSLNRRPLAITITRSGDTLTASADARYIHNWRYVSSATRVACNKAATFNSLTASNGNTVTLDSTNRDHTFCFTAVGNNNFRATGYGIYPDKGATTISFELSGDTLTATASTAVVSRASWIYGVRDDAICNRAANEGSRNRQNPDTASGRSATVSLTSAHRGNYLCFWVVPSDTNLFANGFASYHVVAANTRTPTNTQTPTPDTTPPVISVSQSAVTVIATANEPGVSDWRYWRSHNEPANCNGSFASWDDLGVIISAYAITGLTAADAGTWVCFRVKDAAGNYGYKSFRIETISQNIPPPDNTRTPPADNDRDTNTPGQTNQNTSPDPSGTRATTQDQTTDQDTGVDETPPDTNNDPDRAGTDQTDSDDESGQPATAAESGLPANWDELTNAEKVNLNPLGCDLKTQWLWAEDGSCHNKPVVVVEQPDQTPPPPVEDRPAEPVEPQPEAEPAGPPIDRAGEPVPAPADAETQGGSSWFGLLLVFVIGVLLALIGLRFYSGRQD